MNGDSSEERFGKGRSMDSGAFPSLDTGVGSQSGNRGMTLRDYFAAKALPAIQTLAFSVDPNAIANHLIAWRAYEMADAMLKARNQ